MGEVNDELKRQFLHFYPEVSVLIDRLNKIENRQDRFFYRELALKFIILNTSQNDMEVLGVLARMLHTSNKELDELYKKRSYENP